jgi:hypothetical protein
MNPLYFELRNPRLPNIAKNWRNRMQEPTSPPSPEPKPSIAADEDPSRSACDRWLLTSRARRMWETGKSQMRGEEFRGARCINAASKTGSRDPHVTWETGRAMLASPRRQKTLTRLVWASSEPECKFKGPHVHFRSPWTYLTQRDKSRGLWCISLFYD